MKTIIFSFDDARSDFYSRAFPIMNSYRIPSTLNVITGFMRDNPEHSAITCSGYREGITCEELLHCYKSGLVEIACHGAHHLNTKEDIEQNITDLKNIGIKESVLGFASPNSELTEQNKNELGIWEMIETGKLLYVRSGIQIRREGYIYSALSILDKYVHSNALFYYLNRNNIFQNDNTVKSRVLPSITIFSYTKVHQIQYLIEHAQESSIIILMFHSVLKKEDTGYGKDKFSIDADTFDSLCSYLKSCNDVQLCMTKDLFNNI